MMNKLPISYYIPISTTDDLEIVLRDINLLPKDSCTIISTEYTANVIYETENIAIIQKIENLGGTFRHLILYGNLNDMIISFSRTINEEQNFVNFILPSCCFDNRLIIVLNMVSMIYTRKVMLQYLEIQLENKIKPEEVEKALNGEPVSWKTRVLRFESKIMPSLFTSKNKIHMKVLRTIKNSTHPITIKKLSDSCNVTVNSINNSVYHLENDDLIYINKTEKPYRITITLKGKLLIEDDEKKYYKVFSEYSRNKSLML